MECEDCEKLELWKDSLQHWSIPHKLHKEKVFPPKKILLYKNDLNQELEMATHTINCILYFVENTERKWCIISKKECKYKYTWDIIHISFCEKNGEKFDKILVYN